MMQKRIRRCSEIGRVRQLVLWPVAALVLGVFGSGSASAGPYYYGWHGHRYYWHGRWYYGYPYPPRYYYPPPVVYYPPPVVYAPPPPVVVVPPR
jgi:hypothetical protein